MYISICVLKLSHFYPSFSSPICLSFYLSENEWSNTNDEAVFMTLLPPPLPHPSPIARSELVHAGSWQDSTRKCALQPHRIHHCNRIRTPEWVSSQAREARGRFSCLAFEMLRFWNPVSAFIISVGGVRERVSSGSASNRVSEECFVLRPNVRRYRGVGILQKGGLGLYRRWTKLELNVANMIRLVDIYSEMDGCSLRVRVG